MTIENYLERIIEQNDEIIRLLHSSGKLPEPTVTPYPYIPSVPNPYPPYWGWPIYYTTTATGGDVVEDSKTVLHG